MDKLVKDIFSTEPHTFEDIKESLDLASADRTGFIDLLKKHHDFLKESIKILMDPNRSEEDKRLNLTRFYRLVEMHGKAEQETLYVHLKKNSLKLARLEGLGGQDEHDIAFQLEDELKEMGYPLKWTEEIEAKAIRAAGLVKNHIKEEESTMFSIAKKCISDSDFEGMRVDYIQKCRTYLLSSENTFKTGSKTSETIERTTLH